MRKVHLEQGDRVRLFCGKSVQVSFSQKTTNLPHETTCKTCLKAHAAWLKRKEDK